VVGAPEVRSRGGEVIIIPLTPGHSTTSTIERLRGR
jgi:bifunctional ADP-heptose synthase (sugar kinase/adenylyltransferase)